LKKRILPVVGITPVREKSWPKSALRKVDLPTFTSPTTTNTNGSFRLAMRLSMIAADSESPAGLTQRCGESQQVCANT
jgi:hypothetical protein